MPARASGLFITAAILLLGSNGSSQALVSLEQALPLTRTEGASKTVPKSSRSGTWGVGPGSQGNGVLRPVTVPDQGRSFTK